MVDTCAMERLARPRTRGGFCTECFRDLFAQMSAHVSGEDGDRVKLMGSAISTKPARRLRGASPHAAICARGADGSLRASVAKLSLVAECRERALAQGDLALDNALPED